MQYTLIYDHSGNAHVIPAFNENFVSLHSQLSAHSNPLSIRRVLSTTTNGLLFWVYSTSDIVRFVIFNRCRCSKLKNDRSSGNTCKQWAANTFCMVSPFTRSGYLTLNTQYYSDTLVLIDCKCAFLDHAMRAHACVFSFFLSLTFWGLASLSIVYAKGYPGLLVLRFAASFHVAFKSHP